MEAVRFLRMVGEAAKCSKAETRRKSPNSIQKILKKKLHRAQPTVVSGPATSSPRRGQRVVLRRPELESCEDCGVMLCYTCDFELLMQPADKVDDESLCNATQKTKSPSM